jgi:hypothetical protein
MKFIKNFDINLNITNINDIFTKNLDSKLLNLINDKYNNKCYLNSYILNINKIINRSLLESNQNDLNCSFNIYIQFEAECLIYNTNEVILNMEIQEIINNNILLKRNNILALVKNNTDLNKFKKNDKLPIIVGKVKYTVGSDKISINAYPFIPIINENIYYKLSNLSESDFELLNENILKYIQEEETIKLNILKKSKNIWTYFQNLVYPYKIKSDIKSKNTIDILDYINTLKNKSNNSDKLIICLDNKTDISNRFFCIYKEDEIDKYIKNNSYLILYELCKKYYLYLKLINDLSITYNTEKLISENKEIFDIYNKYKK